MFASRAQHIHEVILPALAEGRIVLCDRFTDSTEAYQGGGRKLGSKSVLQLHEVLCGNLHPDLTILLDNEVAFSVERARRRNRKDKGRSEKGAERDENRFEQESRAFFGRVRHAYLAIASREPHRMHVVNARGTPSETHAIIMELVRKKLKSKLQCLASARSDISEPSVTKPLCPFPILSAIRKPSIACARCWPAIAFRMPSFFPERHGSGKYTLALMLARTMNCLEQPVTDGLPDFCGHCSNCTRIAQSADFDARFAEAVEARENLRDTDKKETRLFVQTHPDVLIIPPDPPQMMIKVDQVRHVIDTIYYRPGEARERVYIFTSFGFHERSGKFAAQSSGRTARVRDDFSAHRKCRRIAAHDSFPIDDL